MQGLLVALQICGRLLLLGIHASVFPVLGRHLAVLDLDLGLADHLVLALFPHVALAHPLCACRRSLVAELLSVLDAQLELRVTFLLELPRPAGSFEGGLLRGVQGLIPVRAGVLVDSASQAAVRGRARRQERRSVISKVLR